MIGKSISHYKILAKLGSGGMGVVYKAEDTKLKRTVALKFLPGHTLANEQVKARFLHEAQAAAALHHPNICTVHEIDEVDERPFIAMAYVEGETLQERVARGPLPVDEAVDVATQVAQGLQEAHENTIVHRDIKSSNILISNKGQALILDFGLAKLGDVTRVTKEGTTVGTVLYMSPEQGRGDEVDHRTDIWSLGVVLYEMLTGRTPFRGEHEQAVMYAILNDDPPPPTSLRSDLPLELERIIGKALAKDPRARYATIEDMLVDLRRLKAQSASSVSMSGAFERPQRRKVPIIVWVAAALLIVLVAVRSFVSPGRDDRIESIAVLPLDNVSQDPEQEYFADGMTDALIGGLAKIGDLRVISRTSIMQYKGVRKPLPDIARELGVDAVLEGTVVRAGNRVRINLQLIQASTDEHVWAEYYDRDLSDILTLQNEVATAVAAEIAVTLTPATRDRLAAARPVDPAALDAYIRGRYQWNQRTPQSIRNALALFKEAVAIDPDYALAWAGLAETYVLCISYELLNTREAQLRLIEAGESALALDATLGEAHTALAAGQTFTCDWPAVLEGYERAIEMNPSYATARQWYAEALSELGRHEEAIAEIKRAQALDPLSLIIRAVASNIYCCARDYDKALATAQEAIDMNPNFAVAWREHALTSAIAGDHEQAIHSLRRFNELIGSGLSDSIRTIYDERGWVPVMLFFANNVNNLYGRAVAAALSGDVDETFARLEDGYAEGCATISAFATYPAFDVIRDDPRYAELLKRVNLDKPVP